MRPLKKELLLWTRTLHIYLSMLALVLLFFFSFTGFLLNHDTWFRYKEPRIIERQASLPADIAAAQDRLAVVEYLRKFEQARGEVTSFDRQDDITRIQFTGPGRKIEFEITHDTGDTAVHEELFNALGVLTDLHMGKHTGTVWPRVLDAAAILLFLVTLSGLILWISLAKRRRLGLAALTLGIGLCAGIYFLLIP